MGMLSDCPFIGAFITNCLTKIMNYEENCKNSEAAV